MSIKREYNFFIYVMILCMVAKNPTKHLIAYIDFLGTKERIRNDINDKHFLFLSNLYKDLFSAINSKNKEQYKYLKKFKVRTFSDNILFATSANLTNIQLCYALGDFVHIAATIQAETLKEGFLVRGGITVGDIFINDYLAYGKGLLDVIELEECVAYFPRIILHESLEQKCSDYYLANKNTVVDIDNIRYIDFYTYCVNDKNSLDKCATQLEQMKKHKSCKSYKVVSKLNWAINKHNEFVKQIYNDENIYIHANKLTEEDKKLIRCVTPAEIYKCNKKPIKTKLL